MASVVDTFTPLVGIWAHLDGVTTYQGPDEESKHPHGLAIAESRMADGTVDVMVQLAENEVAGISGLAGNILIGFRSLDEGYYAVGLGGYGNAYCVSEFVPGLGWKGIEVIGSGRVLQHDRWYRLRVTTRGAEIEMEVDGARVIHKLLPSPLARGHIGLQAWGFMPVRYRDFRVAPSGGEVFVVMPLDERHEQVYRSAIKPVVQSLGLATSHGGELLDPGRIMKSVVERIQRATLVMADITSGNQNVFYELGFAHAFEKPTLLIAERGNMLPFDVSGYRCIFYDATSEGMVVLRAKLREHIGAALEILDSGDA